MRALRKAGAGRRPGRGAGKASLLRQPKAVWAVTFACVVSFMGIGLVDPILPALASQLRATPAQVELLFTSYLLVTAVAMLVTGTVASRIGPRSTLMAGLGLIVVFSALAGASGTIGQIVAFRAGWGLGNALFIATSLAVIVGAASGGFAGAIILYETALGVGIALGPLVGGLLGSLSWRGPFFGVTVLMATALVLITVLLEPLARPARSVSLLDPLRSLGHRGLRSVSLTAFCYNWGFFTLLGYSPFTLNFSAVHLGLVFFGWGLMVALFAVVIAPRLMRRFGTAPTLYVNLCLIAADLVAIGLFTTSHAAVIVAIVAAGAFIGVNNTLVTQAVMSVSTVQRPVASAAYSFVRFLGAALAPYAAGRLAAQYSEHAPFLIGALAVLVGALILRQGHDDIAAADARMRLEAHAALATTDAGEDEAEATGGSSD